MKCSFKETVSSRYDIKGCEVSRWTEPAPEGSQVIVVLKDLNFKGQHIILGEFPPACILLTIELWWTMFVDDVWEGLVERNFAPIYKIGVFSFQIMDRSLFQVTVGNPTPRPQII